MGKRLPPGRKCAILRWGCFKHTLDCIGQTALPGEDIEGCPPRCGAFSPEGEVMRRFVLASLALVLLLPLAAPCFGQALPAPKTEAIFPGVTRINYAGQVFVFTTTVRLSATFLSVGFDRIQIQVKTNYTLAEGMSLAPGQMVRIYWEEGDENLYDGDPPENGWMGLVLTEGGLTEK